MGSVRDRFITGSGEHQGTTTKNYSYFKSSYIKIGAVSQFSLFFLLLKDQSAKGQRINKETGELSASGELSVSLESKVVNVEGSCWTRQLPQVLSEQLQELGIHTRLNSDHSTDQVPLEQKEEQLFKFLPLYIQVLTTATTI